MKKELIPKFSNQKSFYGKALVEKRDHYIALFSYDKIVASILQDENGVCSACVYGTEKWDSNTTLKHIKEFLRQYGYEASSKKQIEKDYLMEV